MRLTRRQFERLVLRAFEELPPGMEGAIENVAILVEDRPSEDDIFMSGLGGQEDLFGLYTGVPLPERGGALPPLPDRITLFQRPIESACASMEDVVREIRVTLLHELGHYLGMDEEDLERMGYG